MNHLHMLDTDALRALLDDAFNRLHGCADNFPYMRKQAQIIIAIMNELEKRGESRQHEYTPRGE